MEQFNSLFEWCLTARQHKQFYTNGMSIHQRQSNYITNNKKNNTYIQYTIKT